MSVTVRPMTPDDVEGAVQVQRAAFDDYDRRMGDPVEPLTEAARARAERRHRHLLIHDPDGCWVATAGDRVVGCALALRRDLLWGLSLLVVDPAQQSAGVGRQLLDASLRYAGDCERRVILSSRDARAIRAYGTSGLDLHPQVRAHGRVDAARLLPSRRARPGGAGDRGLAEQVALEVRGAAHGADHDVIASNARLYVVDDASGRGFAYVRPDGIVHLLVATDDDTATDLLWRCLAHTVEAGSAAEMDHITAAQQWAIRVAYRARLVIEPAGPVFWGGAAPPRSYLPSGAYF